MPLSRSPQMPSKPRTTARKLSSRATTVAKSICTRIRMKLLSKLSASSQADTGTRSRLIHIDCPAVLTTPRQRMARGWGGTMTRGPIWE